MRNNVRKRVLVLFGGESCEHDISIITGVMTVNCIDKNKYDAIPCYITEEGWFTGKTLTDIGFYKQRDLSGLTRLTPVFKKREIHIIKGRKLKPLGEIYCAINCCHGLNGEDGSIAGVINLLGIPFASPDMLASSVCMDKCATKTFLEGVGVKVLPYRTISLAVYFRNKNMALDLTERKLGYPLIVKPSRLGSSIGIRTAKNRDELASAMEYAFRFDGKIIVEKALEEFVEINCAVYRTAGRIVTSECERPFASNEILSFDDKYKNGLKHGLSRQFPADIPVETANEIKQITGLVYRKLFATGVIRMDFLLKNSEVYLNEINTVPGSLALYLFKEKTSEFSNVITELIEEGVRIRREYDNGCFSYKTDVLNCEGSKINASKRSTI